MTKHLSDFRLAHVWLLEEHCATTVLLHHWEGEVVNLERREGGTAMVETLSATCVC